MWKCWLMLRLLTELHSNLSSLSVSEVLHELHRSIRQQWFVFVDSVRRWGWLLVCKHCTLAAVPIVSCCHQQYETMGTAASVQTLHTSSRPHRLVLSINSMRRWERLLVCKHCTLAAVPIVSCCQSTVWDDGDGC